MKDNELQFERSCHVLYSGPCKKEIRARIAQHYPEAEREAVWERVQRQYVDFLSDWRTDLGGKKNFHNGSGGTYDRIFYFSFAFGVLGAILAFLCRYEEGRPPVVREPQEVSPLHGLRKFLYPAAARPAVIEFFVMLGVSCCNIFIFTYAVLQGYANPSFFMVVAALSMTVSNLASGRLLRALGHRTLLSIAMVLSGALIALIALVPCQATFYLGGVGFGMAQGFSFPILTLLAVDNVPQNHRGTANSTMLMAGDLGVGLGTLLWGISIQFCGFHVSIALSGLAVILSGVLSLLFYCRCKP